MGPMHWETKWQSVQSRGPVARQHCSRPGRGHSLPRCGTS